KRHYWHWVLLLRTRGERPGGYRTNNSFDEIASSHCLPQGLGPRQPCNYSRDLRPAKWGSGQSLHGSNPEPLMSALGQKRTFAVQKGMSALPPKADIISSDQGARGALSISTWPPHPSAHIDLR